MAAASRGKPRKDSHTGSSPPRRSPSGSAATKVRSSSSSSPCIGRGRACKVCPTYFLGNTIVGWACHKREVRECDRPSSRGGLDENRSDAGGEGRACRQETRQRSLAAQAR